MTIDPICGMTVDETSPLYAERGEYVTDDDGKGNERQPVKDGSGQTRQTQKLKQIIAGAGGALRRQPFNCISER